MTFMALNSLPQCMCDVGDKSSVGDNATTQVAVTVGVEKCDGNNKLI